MAAQNFAALGGKNHIVTLFIGEGEILLRLVDSFALPAELERLVVCHRHLDALNVLALVWNCLAPLGQMGVHHHIPLPALGPGKDEINVGQVLRVLREPDAGPARVARVVRDDDELDGIILGPELPEGLIGARELFATDLAICGWRLEASLTVLRGA